MTVETSNISLGISGGTPPCAERTNTNVTVLIREERRKPHQLVLVFPLDKANPGNAQAWCAIFEGACDFSSYCHDEVPWEWLHHRTRPCRDEGRIKEALDYWAGVYAEDDEEITFTVRQRISHNEKRKSWGL